MKTTLMVLSALLITAGMANAQGPSPRKTVEERVKAAFDKIEDFKLDKDKQTQTDSVLTQFYRGQDKIFEELRNGGAPVDRDKVRGKMQGLRTERDDKLKQIFNEQQYKRWKDEIEPSLRPPRPSN